MKIWFVFGGHHYYPSGGMEDFIESFATEEEALKFIEEKKSEYDWLDAKNITEYT